MRIAIDVRSLMEGRHSGVEEYTIRIIRALVRVAPIHTYHLFYNSARRIDLPDLPHRTHVHAFRYPNKVFNLAQWAVSQPRWNRLVKADVFFVPNPRLIPLSSRVPLVTVAHDLSFERFPEFLDLRRRMWHRMMRPRSLMESSTRIIAVSEHTQNDLLDLYGIDSNRISVIRSGISDAYRAPRSLQVQAVRTKYRLPEKFVLYLGRLEPRKNIPGIIRAFSAIASDVPHHLVIAGEQGWREEEIFHEVHHSPFRDRIHFAGFIVEEDKPAVYAAADVFTYPSFYEGFGFPPLESLLAGTPVITSFNSSLPEVVGPWATMVDPYNTSQVAAVMREMLTDPQRVPESTRQEIRSIYSWDAAAKKTIDVIVDAARS